MARAAKLTDVALHAGVSIPTASRVLRGVPNVDAVLRERVLQSAALLGYQPNRLAKSLREQRTGIIGFLSSDSIASFHNVLAQGIQKGALDHGHSVIVGSCGTTEMEMTYARIFEGYKVDGLIVVPAADRDPYLEERAQHIPIVEVDRTFGQASRMSVLLDNHGAMGAAVDHLVALGHRDIALVYGDAPVSTEIERRQGFVDRMRHHGLPLPETRLVADDYSEEGGLRAGRQLLQAGNRPSAVVVTTNEMLAGIVQALRAGHLSLPDDLSLIGMDDSRWTRMMEPPLSVIAQPAFEMGYEAARLLIQSITQPTFPLHVPHVHRLSARLVLRASTAPPKEA